MGFVALRERPVRLLAWSAVLSVAAIGVALVSQHVYGIEPCPWCVLQRLIFATIALVCIVALIARRPVPRRIAGGLTMLLAICGIVAALWQHFVAAASASCNMTFADRVMTTTGIDGALPEIFEARASCADAAVKVLGVPYEFYSLLLFILLGLAAALVLAQPTRRFRR